MKKSVSIFISMLLIIQLIPMLAFADLELGLPRHSIVGDSGSTSVQIPQVGNLKTEIDINGAQGDNACLIAALYDQNSNLLGVNIDSKSYDSSKSQTLAAQLNIPSLDGYTYKYYVWDSITGLKPYVIPKNVPTDLTATRKVGKVSLDWKANITDGSFKEFVVYRDGMEIGRTAFYRFDDNGVPDGSSHVYKVATCLNDGTIVSKTTDEVTSSANTMLFFSFDNPDKSYGLTHYAYQELTLNDEGAINQAQSDSCTLRVANFNGRNCRMGTTYQISSTATRTSNVYFKVDNTLITSSDAALTFEVVYFDNGTSTISLQYNAIPADGQDPATNNIAKGVGVATKANTGKWKKAVVNVTDANLRKPTALNSCDFRIAFTGNSTDNYIYSVAVCKTADYVPARANIIIGSGIEENDITLFGGGGTPGTYFGKDASKIAPNTNVLFNANTTRFGTTANRVALTATYYDTGSDTLTVDYGTKDNIVESKSATMSGKNDWVKRTFILDNVKFGDLVSSADFGIHSSGDLYLKEVSMVKLYPNGATADFTSGAGVYNGLSFTEISDSAPDAYGTWTSIGGRNCRATGTFYDSANATPLRNKYMYFGVDDTYLKGPADSYAIITASYYDGCKKPIGLDYNTTANLYKNKNILTQTGTNTWKTFSVILTDAAFTNGQGSYKADFRLFLGSNRQDSIDQLYISDVKVTFANKAEFIINDGIPTVFLAGDSLCSDYDPLASTLVGWGTKISSYFDTSIKVRNFAQPGRTAVSFMSEGRLDNILNEAVSGDYLFIQFGHNESMADARHVTVEDYKTSLKTFITRAWAKQVNPVLLTSLRLYNFGTDGMISDDAIDEYRSAMVAVAAEMNVPVVDVGSAHRAYLNSLGKDTAGTTFALPDSTHLNSYGADEVSKLIINGIKSNNSIRVLKSYIEL